MWGLRPAGKPTESKERKERKEKQVLSKEIAEGPEPSSILLQFNMNQHLLHDMDNLIPPWHNSTSNPDMAGF